MVGPSLPVGLLAADRRWRPALGLIGPAEFVVSAVSPGRPSLGLGDGVQGWDLNTRPGRAPVGDPSTKVTSPLFTV